MNAIFQFPISENQIKFNPIILQTPKKEEKIKRTILLLVFERRKQNKTEHAFAML